MKRILVCAVLLAWSGLALAVVYKWADAQGNAQYGDRPPDGVHAEVVELLGSRSGRQSTSRATAGVTGADAPASKGAANAAAGRAADQQAVDEDVAQAKLKQCADAQERYKKLIEGRRLYKEGPDGERQYLTSDEIDAERLNARRELDTVCNSPT
jgi:hypothetical protein